MTGTAVDTGLDPLGDVVEALSKEGALEHEATKINTDKSASAIAKRRDRPMADHATGTSSAGGAQTRNLDLIKRREQLRLVVLFAQQDPEASAPHEQIAGVAARPWAGKELGG